MHVFVCVCDAQVSFHNLQVVFQHLHLTQGARKPLQPTQAGAMAGTMPYGGAMQVRSPDSTHRSCLYNPRGTPAASPDSTIATGQATRAIPTYVESSVIR